jgi:creatinine amidohydrolase
LVYNLVEDGFTNIHLLTVGIEPLPEIKTIHLPCLEGHPLLDISHDKEKIVILPIGHTEQHGHHAPLCTDTTIIEAVAQGTAEAASSQALCLPVFPYGVSSHRRSFPGTFSVGGRTFEDFWLSVLDVLVETGFTRFYLMNGHGGNSSYLVNVVKHAGEKYQRIFCATAYLYLSGPKGIAALETKRESPIGGMGHAPSAP